MPQLAGPIIQIRFLRALYGYAFLVVNCSVPTMWPTGENRFWFLTLMDGDDLAKGVDLQHGRLPLLARLQLLQRVADAYQRVVRA